MARQDPAATIDRGGKHPVGEVRSPGPMFVYGPPSQPATPPPDKETPR
jgi:hypothetical protein